MVRNFYVEALAKLGYKQDPVMKNLYVSDRKVPVEISENNQSWILKQYVERERWFTDEFYIIFEQQQIERCQYLETRQYEYT